MEQLTVSEAMEQYKVSRLTVLMWIYKNKVVAKKIGPIWVIDKGSLDNHIKTREIRLDEETKIKF